MSSLPSPSRRPFPARLSPIGHATRVYGILTGMTIRADAESKPYLAAVCNDASERWLFWLDHNSARINDENLETFIHIMSAEYPQIPSRVWDAPMR